ncbi:hypothetical protein RJ639_026741 [Escallonia herrerae]|uniref:Protein TIFY n=1 Tax=Escallonia herrerae TaxID=1293975 RepID=A0AA89BQI8_9ASTE|nr:hypothetical protein RJ639_026741 [Escallonia herrerae]
MSSSSEIVDSSRFASQKAARVPEKSNFSQTCNLLSQYLKEKRSLGDLNLGMNCNFEPNGMPAPVPAPTMNLFPVDEKSGGAVTRNRNSKNFFPQQAGFGTQVSTKEVPKSADLNANKSQPENAQMTIFYGGQVIVFNDFPAEKAKEIMLLASGGMTQKPNTFPANFIQKPTEATNLVAPVSNFDNNIVQQPPQPVVSGLPIARKNSLARFLEKRKDRIIARAPYQATNAAAPSKPGESKSWLGLAAQSPVPFENQS